ncbi:hypothetical protein DPMN_027060 [Dreissena polymorpha]|uniref:Defensin n=1 Tax=Dreissena polymorpha TaxID=45954 RepID=D1MFM5_DREPO|nr:defensin [Dreissena polymorpha]KAH3864048.1 hypothetical protein DPMN_027060 [Dreissena polymorpha]
MMSKLVVFSLLIAAAVMSVSAAPQKRITCDLLGGVWILGADTACAGHCYTLNHPGGHCEGGYCYCRPGTFSEILG